MPDRATTLILISVTLSLTPYIVKTLNTITRMFNFSSTTRTSLYNAAFYLVPLTLGAGTLYFMLKTRRAKAAAKKKLGARKPAKQAEHNVPSPEAVGSGAPMYAGVRVLELATHVAAPSAGRCMADLGAEVVHVEPPSGDLWRKTLAEYEQKPFPRAYGTAYVSSTARANPNRTQENSN